MPKQTNNTAIKMPQPTSNSVSAWRESPQQMGEEVYLSHIADDPHSSAYQRPNKENKSKEKECGRQWEGRHTALTLNGRCHHFHNFTVLFKPHSVEM